MPKIIDDRRDTVKEQLGDKLKELVRLDKKDGDNRFIEFLVNSGLSEEEIQEVRYDGEIWAHPKQHIDFSAPCPRYTMVLAGRSFGKSVRKNTPILTANKGWITVGEVEIGDYVFGQDGKPTEVVDYQEDEPEKCYKVEFDTGEKLVVDSRHLWTTWTHRDRKRYMRKDSKWYNDPKDDYEPDWPMWMAEGKNGVEVFGPKVRTTEDIRNTLRHSKRGDLNHSIPTTHPVEFEYQEVPIDPYILGLWLGDGCKSSGYFVSVDPEIIQAFRDAGYDVSNSNHRDDTYYIKGLVTDLKRLGFYKNKHIPKSYMENTIDVRLELLRGLMDSDGHIDQRPKGTGKNRVEFCQAGNNLGIAKDVVKLVASLGEKLTWRESDSVLNGEVKSRRIRVAWKPNRFNPFRLKRKYDVVQKYLETLKGQGTRTRQRMITAVNPVPAPEEGLRCLTVDNDSSLFLVGETLIPTHNSWALGYTVKRLVEKHKLTKIAVCCKTARDIKITIVPAIEKFYDDKDPDKPIFNKHSNIIYYPKYDAEVVCYSSESGEDAPRGGNFEAVLLDEAAFFHNNEGIIDNLDLACRLEPSLMIGFTSPFASPNLLDWYQKWKDGDPNYRFITGTSFENLDNLSESFKTSLEAKVNTTRGRQEVLGELVLENPEALWNMQTIEDNLVKQGNLPDMVEISIGVDPSINAKGQGAKGRAADSTGIIVAGLGEDGLLYVLDDHTNSFTVEKWVAKVCDLYDHYTSEVGKVKIQMESNVIGKQAMKHIFMNVGRVDVFKVIDFQFSTQSKLQRLQPYSLLAEQGKVMYVDKRSLSELFKELCSFTGKGKKSPDRADAFVFALNQIEPTKKRFTKVYDLIL